MVLQFRPTIPVVYLCLGLGWYWRGYVELPGLQRDGDALLLRRGQRYVWEGGVGHQTILQGIVTINTARHKVAGAGIINGKWRLNGYKKKGKNASKTLVNAFLNYCRRKWFIPRVALGGIDRSAQDNILHLLQDCQSSWGVSPHPLMAELQYGGRRLEVRKMSGLYTMQNTMVGGGFNGRWGKN